MHPKKKRHRKKSPVLLVVTSLFLLAVATLLLTPSPRPKRETLLLPLSNESKIIKKVVQQPIYPGRTPVHLFLNDVFAGSGTLINLTRGERILTSAHLFYKEVRNGIYTYKILRPLSDERFPISGIETINGGEIFDVALDAIVCVPGNAKPIQGFSDSSPWKSEDFHGEHVRFYESIPITSLTTFEKTRCIGGVKQLPYFLFPYETIPGESGTCFNSDNDPREVFVVKGHIYTTPEIRQEFRLAESDSVLAVGVRIVLK